MPLWFAGGSHSKESTTMQEIQVQSIILLSLQFVFELRESGHKWPKECASLHTANMPDSNSLNQWK